MGLPPPRGKNVDRLAPQPVDSVLVNELLRREVCHKQVLGLGSDVLDRRVRNTLGLATTNFVLLCLLTMTIAATADLYGTLDDPDQLIAGARERPAESASPQRVFPLAL